MDSFPLTKKKLLQQPPARRQRIIADWLRQIYLKLLDQSMKPDSIEHTRINYVAVLAWIDEQPVNGIADIPVDHWIEFIADRFHYHKKKSGIGLSEHNFLPKVKTGDKTDNSPWKPLFRYKVALDNLRSAFNVGSIFRLVDGAGFESLIIGGCTPGKNNQQVSKTSMGSSQWIPQEKSNELPALLSSYQQSGFRIIGIETVERSESHLEFLWPQKGIVVLGNEEYGLSQKVLTVCDDFVHLPMFGRKNSINVANAFAVVAFHIANTFAHSLSS